EDRGVPDDPRRCGIRTRADTAVRPYEFGRASSHRKEHAMTEDHDRNGVFSSKLTRRDLGRYAAAAGIAGLTRALLATGSPVLAAAALAQEQGRGGTAVEALWTDTETLDPYKSFGPLYGAFRNLYDPLTEINLKNEIDGILAERWEISADGL